MIEFLTLITLMCQQPVPGHGNGSFAESTSAKIREQAFAAQSSCIKRLYKECTNKHKITGTALPGYAECLVEKL